MKLFISNLAPAITTENIHSLFSAFGKVKAAHVAVDDNKQSRGFAYVVMEDEKQGTVAIEALNKKKFMQQYISVSEAIPSQRYHDSIAV